MMQAVRVACIGTGYFSKFHFDAWHRISGAALVGFTSKSVAGVQSTGLPAFNDVGKMLKSIEIDLVDIITPPSTHLELIRECAAKGVKTIICQKPFCNSIQEAKQAIETCKQTETLLIVHENFRFQPWYRAMKQAIEKGMLGDVLQLSFRLRTGDGQGPEAYLDRQPYFQDMEKFLIRETGVHWIDTFKFLLGEPTAVYADLRKLNPAIVGEDAGYFIMEFPDNRRALFDANRHLDHDAQDCRTTLGEALLEGTRGSISLSGSGEVRFRQFGSQETRILLAAKQWEGFGGDCVLALQKHVIEHLKHGTLLENSAIEYLSVLEMEAAIYHSARTGRKVML